MDEHIEQSPIEITDELAKDLATFSELYVDRIRAAILKNIGNIAQDTTLVHMLHEYAVRKEKERADYARTVIDVALCAEYRPANNCLTHSNSYKDVLEDLLKVYWQ